MESIITVRNNLCEMGVEYCEGRITGPLIRVFRLNDQASHDLACSFENGPYSQENFLAILRSESFLQAEREEEARRAGLRGAWRSEYILYGMNASFLRVGVSCGGNVSRPRFFQTC